MKYNDTNKDTFSTMKMQNNDSFPLPKALTILVVVILIGSMVGWLIGKNKNTTTNEISKAPENTSSVTKKTVGVTDKKNFKDSVEGILREGGIEGEGNFYIERPGGKSQNAYLTSSTIDMSEYIGKKVKTWGETYKGEKVGWLMDVGAIEVLE